MSRLAILWDPDGPGPRVAVKETKAIAQAFKLDLQSLEIRGPNPDLEDALQAAKKERRQVGSWSRAPQKDPGGTLLKSFR